MIPGPPTDAASASRRGAATAASQFARLKLDDRGVKGGKGHAAAPEAGNVVRFPREWFGPPEELIPFGPSARARPGPPNDPPASPEGSDPPRGERASPPDFWGEGSAMLQGVIEGPSQVQQDGAGGLGSSEPEAVSAPRRVGPEAPTRTPRKRFRRQALIGAGAILASAGAAVAAIGIGTSGRPSAHRMWSVASVPSHSSAAVERNARRPARTAIRQPPKRHAAHPDVVRPVSKVLPAETASSTPVSAVASSDSTPAPSSTPTVSAPSTPSQSPPAQPSSDSSSAASHRPTSGSQSGGAFTLGGP
jgi:hypothetical protein